MKNVELLSPVGDFLCLKAAVQNGADAVYLGASSFNARASAANFDYEELEKAINYAHVRNVKVHLTLNILIKNSEFEEAVLLAKKAYELGVDALIVQDLGLADYLVKHFPNLPLHASTQMTVHNLNGVKQVQALGFKRAVLSRELTLDEVRYICENSDIEIETFIHGALCICYSGQCLFSSMIGGRSGNRGRCAQPCRLPYQLVCDNNTLDKGYLISPKDLCGLEFIPDLINAGVDCFKIEGRMKTPEYVATVTRIYRKYIDLYLNSPNQYKIDEQDKNDLLQVFNRGGFSTGHYNSKPNTELISKEKSNHMGIYIGNVSNYNAKKGHITLNLNDKLEIGDTISFEKEPSKYTVSELMINDKNAPYALAKQVVKIGRMKGNISIGDKIYKLASKSLSELAKPTFSNSEIKKIKLNCKIDIHKDKPIKISVKPCEKYDLYKNISVEIVSDIVPETAINHPISQEKIIMQLSKTNNTPYEFVNIDVKLDDGLYISSISKFNELRRQVLFKLEEIVISNLNRQSKLDKINFPSTNVEKNENKQISLLLNKIDLMQDYSKLENIDNIYIPLKYFEDTKYKDILTYFCSRFKTCVVIPNIIQNNYANIFKNMINNAMNNFHIKGIVLSNIGQLNLIKKYKTCEIIANYNFNIFNNMSIDCLKNLGINKFILSPELNMQELNNISSSTNNTEVIVYGQTPLMNMKYCLLGKTNRCYPKCGLKCKEQSTYYLKDRMRFPISYITR